MNRPSVLVISNQTSAAGDPGYSQALREMTSLGLVSGFTYVPTGHVAQESQMSREMRLIESVRASRDDVVVALSIKDQISKVDEVVAALSGRPLLYWEGDPWGRRKPIPTRMAAWLQASDVVFSVGGQPQTDLLHRHGAAVVVHTVHTYDHVLFAREERAFSWEDPHHSAVFIGSNLSRVPLLTGLPGSVGRRRVVSGLRTRLGNAFLIGGRGWPRSWEAHEVSFPDQGRFIQQGRILANWDHNPHIADYASDRLAIAMISGRAQVTTRHAGMAWVAPESAGVFLRQRPSDVIRTVLSLSEHDTDDLRDLGAASRRWALGRLSHREAMRYILAHAIDGIVKPTGDPWDSLPQTSVRGHG